MSISYKETKGTVLHTGIMCASDNLRYACQSTFCRPCWYAGIHTSRMGRLLGPAAWNSL